VPTATQVAGAVHDTEVRSSSHRSLVLGVQVCCHRQVVPFHCRAVRIGWLAGALLAPPVAVQADALVQDTLSSVDVPWLGAGSACGDQAVPFQTSASGRKWTWRPWTFARVPTATHAFVAVHETPAKVASEPPGGSGTSTAVHAVPFQLSAQLPVTATQNDVDTHETAVGSVVCGRAGSSVQVVPFHCRAAGNWLATGSLMPMTRHAVADEHETVSRVNSWSPAGSGTVSFCQAVPFQVCASGSSAPLLLCLKMCPVARQNVAGGHEIAASVLAASYVLTSFCLVRREPSQCSAAGSR